MDQEKLVKFCQKRIFISTLRLVVLIQIFLAVTFLSCQTSRFEYLEPLTKILNMLENSTQKSHLISQFVRFLWSFVARIFLFYQNRNVIWCRILFDVATTKFDKIPFSVLAF